MTADGEVRIANACTNPDLFWALKGGGGGFGVVTRVTLRTHELPEFFGGVFATIKATSDDAFRRLIGRSSTSTREALFNPHWGEQIAFAGAACVTISMVFQGLAGRRRGGLAAVPRLGRRFAAGFRHRVGAADLRRCRRACFWDPSLLKLGIQASSSPTTARARRRAIFSGPATTSEAGAVWHGYHSAWLPASLLEADRRESLVDALFAAAQHWGVSLHFNKGLAGAPPEAIAAASDTAMNPAVVDAFALAIIGAADSPPIPAFPDTSRTRRPRRTQARRDRPAMNEFRKLRPASAPMCGRPTSSSRTGRTPSGATTMRGSARSRTNTIPAASSSSIMASAAKTGARTDLHG